MRVSPRPSNSDRRYTTRELSPEGGVWWPKFWFDPTLRARAAAESTVDLRFRWTCEGFDDGPDGVRVHVCSAEHGHRTVRAGFLVACDGAASPIRKKLGIASLRDSECARARWQGAFVRLPGLRERIPHAPAVQYYLINPRRIILGSLDGKDLWRVTYPLKGGEYPAFADVRATIADALDCAIDAVEVLDTYTAERRPHCERMVRRAWHNYRADNAILPDPTLDDPGQAQTRTRLGERIASTRQTEWRSLGAQLDVRYPESSLVVSDGSPEPAADPERYVPTARPGHRAPHVALPDGSSVLDLVRGRFTLLNLAATADSGALLEAFRSRRIPIDVEWVAVERARETYRNAIALVRPDGIVAWRGDTCPVDPDLVVDQVTGRIRSRQC